jgi:hypothetical protein
MTDAEAPFSTVPLTLPLAARYEIRSGGDPGTRPMRWPNTSVPPRSTDAG